MEEAQRPSESKSSRQLFIVHVAEQCLCETSLPALLDRPAHFSCERTLSDGVMLGFSAALGREAFSSFLDAEGRVADWSGLKKVIFFKGLRPEARAEV